MLSGLISFCPGLKEVVETQCRGNMEEKRSKLDRDGFLVIEGVLQEIELTPYRSLFDGITEGRVKVDR